MIADAIGVTKAAVYHQFNTKEEIVVAAAEAELSNVEAAIEAAEAEPTRTRARDVLIIRIVDLAVERCRMESPLLGDPVIMRFFAHHEPFPAGDGSFVPATVFESTAKRACSASTRRITSTDAPSPLTAPGVPRPVGGRPRELLARSPGVELLRLSRPQSVYRTDLLHTDVRLRPAVPAEHVDQFHPQMLEVA